MSGKRGGGGVGTPLYKPYRYVPKARFLRRLSLKTAIHFTHFSLDLGVVFEETSGL